MLSKLSSTLGSNKPLFFVLTLIIGFILVSPYLDYQPLLSQGDHGRDLYCFQKTFEGAKPYRDFWWQYGPLMPYYYSLFFKIFGVSIQSVLIGKSLIVFLCGIFIFLTLMTVVSPIVAFLGAFWFWIFRPEFFYTYNHIGGVLMIIFVIYCLFQYQARSKDEPKKMCIFLGSLGIFLLSLIRLNMGIASLFAFFSCVILADYYKKIPLTKEKIKLYLGVSLITALVTGCVYLYFINGVTMPNLKKCFPYLSAYRYDNVSFLMAVNILTDLVIKNFTATWRRVIFGVILLFSALRVLYLFVNNKLDHQSMQKIRISLYSLVLFLLFISHEFFISGSLYRTFWIIPIIVMLFLLVIDAGLKKIPTGVYGIVLAILLFISFRATVLLYRVISVEKQSVNMFEYGPTKIYVANYMRGYKGDRSQAHNDLKNHWPTTVKETTNYIQKNLGEDKTILAIPYDSLYYFLTGRDSPVYPLAFFDYIHITPEEEKGIIQQLESEEVDFVLLSSRINSLEPHLGVFGKKYCPLLAKYIEDNYKMVAVFGNWEDPADFTRHHGTKILKRTYASEAY